MTTINRFHSSAPFFAFALALASLTSGCFMSADEGRAVEADLVKLKSDFAAARKADDDAEQKADEDREKLKTDQDAQSKRIDAKIHEVNDALDGLQHSARKTGADLAVQLDAQEKEVARLRGLVEEFQVKNAALEQSSSQMQTDFQNRITALEKKAADADAAAKVAATAAAQAAAMPSDPDEFYKLAKKKFDDGDIAASRDLFVKFLSKWKSNSLSDNAQYWIGETYFHDKDFRRAGLEFQKVCDTWPKSDKAPDAAYMVANSFAELNLTDDARTFLQNVIDTYPKTSAAKNAEKKLQELKKKSK